MVSSNGIDKLIICQWKYQTFTCFYKIHNNTLGKYIKNNKGRLDRIKKVFVYKLNSRSCPKVYVGQTERSFGVRGAERLLFKEKHNLTMPNFLHRKTIFLTKKMKIFYI